MKLGGRGLGVITIIRPRLTIIFIQPRPVCVPGAGLPLPMGVRDDEG